ncbi:MAG: protein-glutamate O-methyltransferase CheR [Anaerolineales bacterium]|nr:protein-glutamate O-methyltransferase CheR [Anaerolineales bacterium]
MTKRDNELEDVEIKLFLEGVYQRYGYDFRDYAPASLKRRIRKAMQDEGLETVSALQGKVLRDPAAMQRFLLTISIDVTAMFRDPGCYRAIREKVAPALRTYPFIRIWHAGCATGEEVYSLAIVLEEEGLLDKARIYATDMSQAALVKAKEGIFPLEAMQDYTANYLAAGGAHEFSEYYAAHYGNARFRPELQRSVVWAQHNLVTDASFNEFHLICCRNVLIYFNKSLSEHVHALLYESLPVLGFLVLGSKESLRFTPLEDCYETVDAKEKIYRKIK